MYGNFFGTLTIDNIDREIGSVVYGWYAVAALQAVLVFALVNMGKSPVENLLDPSAYALGGFFIQTRRSRAVAIALALLALVALGITVAGKMGINTGGGTNIFLAAIIALLGYRSITTTWFHHTYSNARTLWGRVVAVSLTSLVLALAGGLGAGMFALSQHPGLPDETVGSIMLAIAFAAFVVLMSLLTLRFPFAVATEHSAETFA